MRIILSLLLIVVGVATVAATYVAGNIGGWWLPKRDPAALGALLAQNIETHVPDGDGPFPVVIQFHGCGGQVDPNGEVQPIMREYAQAAQAAGVGAVIVDSLLPRGIDRAHALAWVCGGIRLRGSERAGDVLAAVEYVRSLPWVDAQRIAVAGWSHGGWAIMDLMSMDLETTLPRNLASAPEAGLAGVKAVYLTYPYTGFPARTREQGWAWTDLEAHVVLAGDDTLAPESEVRAAIAKMRESGVTVSETLIPGVTHAFDETTLEPGSSFKVDAKAAEDARAAYAMWLAKTLDAASEPMAPTASEPPAAPPAAVAPAVEPSDVASDVDVELAADVATPEAPEAPEASPSPATSAPADEAMAAEDGAPVDALAAEEPAAEEPAAEEPAAEEPAAEEPTR